MNRLTVRDTDGFALLSPEHEGKYTHLELIDLLLCCVADYEDTGLEPEEIKELCTDDVAEVAKKLRQMIEHGEIDHLEELLRAESEGRLIKLPSQTVYELTWDAGPNCDLRCPEVADYESCETCDCQLCDRGKLFIYERVCKQEHIELIGKTVFLTREEAEKALKENDERAGITLISANESAPFGEKDWENVTEMMRNRTKENGHDNQEAKEGQNDG